MASHYSDMGFNFKDEKEFNRFISKICGKGKEITTKNGVYNHIKTDEYIEFWFQEKKLVFLKIKENCLV